MHCKIGYLARFVELADKHEVLTLLSVNPQLHFNTMRTDHNAILMRYETLQ